MTCQLERVASCWDEVDALARLHWAGTQGYRRHEPYNPDKDRYILFNDLGFFHLITVRDEAQLVGYFGVYLTKSMHSQIPMAVEDTFFIHPAYRHGTRAIRVIKFIERHLAANGVRDVLFSCEVDNTSGIKGLLELLDYHPVIVQYHKRLPISGTDSAATNATTVGEHESP